MSLIVLMSIVLVLIVLLTFLMLDKTTVTGAPESEPNPFLQAAYEELDRIDGTKIPEIVDVLDGYYTRKIVLDEPVKAEAVYELGNPQPVAFHYEDCHIPKTRKEVRWVDPNDPARRSNYGRNYELRTRQAWR